MIYTSLQLLKAQHEILDAWEWYENKQLGLGDDFKNEVGKKIKSILNDPLKFPLKRKYREAVIDKFPYLIIFDIDDGNKIIFIVSIFHTSRHPKKKY